MAMIKCTGCSSDVSSGATTCPSCGEPLVTPNAKLGNIVSIAVAACIFWYLFGGIENQVADDSVDQYEIASSQGDPMQRCVQAGIVAASYLQAEDPANYDIWKAREGSDCRAAGLPY